MLLKVLLYAYCLKLYTDRKIANAFRSDITFMWLSGKQYPDFRTINNFRSGRLKDSIHTVFKSLLLMFSEGYIRLEEYYCDDTTIQADVNKHKVVWKKNSSRYLEGVKARIDSMLLEIDKQFLNGQKIDALMKYPSYDKEQTKDFRENPFYKENIPYDKENDSFLCPNNKQLIYTGEVKVTNKNGFVSTLRNYECRDCTGCPLVD